MSQVFRARLTGRASRFLDMLRELGHLQPEEAERLLVTVAEVHHGDPPVDIDDVRRVAATILLERYVEDPAGLLTEDWPILFP